MTSTSPPIHNADPLPEAGHRLHALDATRAFALLLGIVFHAGLSFMPVFIGWAVQDVSTSPLVPTFAVVSHSFRMATFFLLAGFFGHITLHRQGPGNFIRSRLVRIAVPLVVGWFVLRPLLVSGWIMGAASLRGPVDVRAGLWGGVQSLANLPTGLFTGSHLWFLYYLLMATTLMLVARGWLAAMGDRRTTLLRCGDTLVAWLVDAPVGLLLLAIPTAAALWFMQGWGMDTPDRSLIPHLPVLAIYSGFFSFGWMLGRQRELISRFARATPLRCTQAGIGIATLLLLGGIERDPAHRHHLAAHVAYALGYAMTMWSLTLLTTAVFQKLCRRPNAMVRYLADSSYWTYLVHLPLVIWLQVAVADWPLHWSFKLAFISTVTIGFSLLTYDLFVRSTLIGGILNGRRRERVIGPWFLRRLRYVAWDRRMSPVARPSSFRPAWIRRGPR